jgi:Flp pilus assembly pilin Flp
MEPTTLSLFVRAQNSAHLASQRAVAERGATTVEYVMILGIMALLVAAIFLLPNTGLRDRIGDLGQKVQDVVGDVSQ